MSLEPKFETSSWYVVHTKPRQEERAESNLRAWRVETYAPKIKVRSLCRMSGQASYKIKPLFPGYIFAHFAAHNQLHKICFTRGVSSIVSFGGELATVDDEIIGIIKSQAAEDNYIRLGEKLKSGDKIMIESGPLQHLTGIFEREIKGSKRILILLTTIKYQGHVMIDRELIRKVS